MCDEWMPSLQLPLTPEHFSQLPRNGAYRYEYLEGTACLSPRPKHYHALLDLQSYRPSDDGQEPAGVGLRVMIPGDLPAVEAVFAAAFQRIQPFGSLDDGARAEAARHCLLRTLSGGDGPWVKEASFVALRSDNQRFCGAILITLLPLGDLDDWESYYWSAPPPANCVEHRLGRPHLTWVFVAPTDAGRNVGTALLAGAVYALRTMGFMEMATTFMLGNDSSMLWHWRNGFQLLPYPGSTRRRRQGIIDKAAR
jgi:hypothetical protein